MEKERINEDDLTKILRKLSKGPIKFEELREWFIENFPDYDFDKMIDMLMKDQLIIIEQIGLVEKYVQLVKEVNAEKHEKNQDLYTSNIEFLKKNIDLKKELVKLLKHQNKGDLEKAIEQNERDIRMLSSKLDDLIEKGEKVEKNELEEEISEIEKLKSFLIDEIKKTRYKLDLKSVEKAVKRIKSIMKEQSVDELTIDRKYLPEIVNINLLEISKSDGLPIFKTIVLEYLKRKGIITRFFGNVIKFTIEILPPED